MTTKRRVDMKALLADPDPRREMMISAIQAIQAREGIETTREQADRAYQKVLRQKIAAAKMKGNLAAHISGSMIILFTPEDSDDYESLILGVAEMRQVQQGMEIRQIWARKGYGPLLYLLCAEWSLPKGLIPSQIKNQVSPAAKKVWREFFEGQGTSFVKIEPIENSPHPEPWLQIRIKPKRRGRLSGLVSKGKVFLSNDPYGEKETMLVEEADSLLREKMAEIY